MPSQRAPTPSAPAIPASQPTRCFALMGRVIGRRGLRSTTDTMIRPIATAFGSNEELKLDAALDAPLRGLPHPSRLERELSLPKKVADAASALGIETVGDLLEHLPREHADRRATTPVNLLVLDEDATVSVLVRSVAVKPMRQRGRCGIEARVSEETGPLVAVWFGRPRFVADQFQPGQTLVLHGRFKPRNQFHVKEHEVVQNGGGGVLASQGLLPLYPATEGLTRERIRNLMWRERSHVHDVVEPLPFALRRAERMPDRPSALGAIHFPEEPDDSAVARERLAFEELLLLELALAGRKRGRAAGARAAEVHGTGRPSDPCLSTLPFVLTGDQRVAVERIEDDMAG